MGAIETGSDNTEEIRSFEEFFKFVKEHPSTDWLYRGQCDAAWDAVPKAGRPEYREDVKNADLLRFANWCNSAIAFAELPSNELERLAIAQHHGLATRLLDWTTNPLVALYFAVSAALHKAGAVLVFRPDAPYNHADIDIRALDQVTAYYPRALVSRIIRQAGAFTIHPRPHEPLRASGRFKRPDLVKAVISPRAKKDLLQVLDSFGVNEVGLFPDLDGLSRHVNRGTEQDVARRAAPV